MKPRILFAALPLALLFAACESPSDPSENEENNRVQLSYGGAVSGTFTSTGDYVAGTAPITQTFAYGTRDAAGTVEVIAYSQRGGSRADFSIITIPEAAVGAMAVQVCPGETCASVSLALDVGHNHGSIATHTCHLDQGTIRVTGLTPGRVAGTVSGSGFCLPAGGGESVPFQLASGTFNVEVRAV